MDNPGKYLLCIDVGTSSVKAACVDQEGRAEGLSREPVLFAEHELLAFPPGRWTEAMRSLIARMPMRGLVAGVIVSGNGPTLVPLDGDGHEIGPALMWVDNRAHRIDGQPSFFLPKAAWMRDTDPASFERVRTFVSCPEYLGFILTGNAVTVTPSADFSPYIWTNEGIDAYRMDRGLFPPFVHPGDMTGTVSLQASATYGLPAGIPVFAGGSDFLMSLLGTATVVPGRTCDRAGTSEGINACSSHPISDRRLRSLPHVIPGLFNNAGILTSTGRMFEWFRGISGQTHVNYDMMLRDVVHLEHGRDIPWFFPTLRPGETWEFSRGMFIGLGPMHGREEMGRAVVESIGYSVREAIELLEENGEDISDLRASGGQAKNVVWNQMKANIVGKPILVPRVEDAELVGNAAAGFFGLGAYQSLAEAAETLVHIKAEYLPDTEEHNRFTARYQEYLHVYQKLREGLRGLQQ
ncbi:MAG TPA: FGGY-family carbohydrate kinase [Spirochaetia bacterium]|nr:FGGY-family carbohydrate kinase [Spirochaetia bacterium]